MATKKPRINTVGFAADYPGIVCVNWDTWVRKWSVYRGFDHLGDYSTWQEAIDRALEEA